MAVAKASRNAYLAVAMLLAAGVVVFANLLADRGFVRVDLTADKKYSLSEPFRTIIGRLDDQMKVTYCVSKAVPDWFEGTKRDILDRLREIEMASKGQIKLEVVDPEDNEELKKELEKENLNFTVGTREKGKLTYTVLNTSLRLTYADKPADWVPVVQRPEDLEYDLANKVYSLTQKEKPVVAIQRPKPDRPPMMMGRQPPDPYGWLLSDPDTLKKVDVKDVDLTESSNIPDGTKLLILVRPKDLGERARYEVVRYLASGGRVLLLASPYKVTNDMFGGGLRVEKAPTGLEEYLKEIGITFDPDFVCDENNVRLPQLNLFTGEVKYLVYPFFVQILPGSIDQESPITRLLPQLVMPFPAAVNLNKDAATKAGVTTTVLASTSSLSWKEPYSDTFDPKNFNEKSAGKNPSLPVFVQMEGTFPFPWEGKPVPAWTVSNQEQEEGAQKKDEPRKDEGKATVERKGSGMLFIWSAPDSFDRSYLEGRQMGEEFQGNIAVLPNIVESCVLGEELVKLRSKQFATRTIHTLNGKDERKLQVAVKLCMIAGSAILLIACGMVYWFVRRSGQVRYEREMSNSGPSSFMP